MIFIHNDIPSRMLTKHVFPGDIEGLFIERNFRKVKRLLFGTSPAISKRIVSF